MTSIPGVIQTARFCNIAERGLIAVIRDEEYQGMAADLIQTYQRFKEKNGQSRLPHFSPFNSTIQKYSFIVGRHVEPEAIAGIRLVLMYELERFRWFDEIVGVPIFRKSLFHSSSDVRQHSRWLADSIILSIVNQRDALQAKESGLATCVRLEMARGLALICEWMERGVPMVAQRNPYLVEFPADHWDSYN